MASITIRNLDDNVKKRLRRQAAENGRSLEAEVREILSRTAEQRTERAKTGLDLIRPLLDFAEKYGGVELEPFPDEFLAEAPAKFRRKPSK
ncbi:MAG: plasmid stabilization protein [Alphaproteobacteria bacterium]|nr:plasmid stabilization protein [Alphaproteobacteria bacterium]MBL7097548.1 plasmid stabilization protein [Alphaproteobacteria bacterium]